MLDAARDLLKMNQPMFDTWLDYAQNASMGAHVAAGREQFDGLAQMAVRLFGCKFAAITLDTGSSHLFIGRAGIDLDEVPHENPFFAAAMKPEGGVVLLDARSDPRFKDHPMTRAEPFIRFFAGVPLIDSAGMAAGTLSVFDTEPHDDLIRERRAELKVLAKATMDCLERWRLTEVNGGLQAVPMHADHEMNRRFEALADALPQLVWSTRSDGQSDYFSKQWCQFTGTRASDGYGTGWHDHVHPEDLTLVSEAWRDAITTGQPYSREFRLRNSIGNYRWMLVRGLPVSDEFGRITRWVGTCTDIDDRVRSGDLMEVMSRELSHRIKNLFAVVQGLIAMALRKIPGMEQVNESLQARMVALGHAHDLIRPHVSGSAIIRPHSTLRQLIEILALPYVGDDPTRLEIVGDDPGVDERGTTPLGLFFHEMALNSALFGALSVPQGRLRIAISVDVNVTIDWLERGGPVISQPPLPAFGLSLTKLGIERQLGGTLTMSWLPEGLHACATFPLRQINIG